MSQGTEMMSDEATGNIVIVDIGRHKRKQVKRLRRGEPSKLLDEVTASVDELRAAGTISDTAETVVVVVREKRKKGLGREFPVRLF